MSPLATTLRERYDLVFEGSNDPLFDWDLEADRLALSSRWAGLVGSPAPEGEHAPAEWLDRIHPEDDPAVRSQLNLHLNGSAPLLEMELRLRREDGTYRWVRLRGRTLRDDRGRPRRIAGSFTDLTEKKKADERYARSAFYDGLTGLPNRGLFIDRVARWLRGPQRQRDRGFALLFLDLDRFTLINESLGHTSGDQVLVEFSRSLEAVLRPTDVAARLGGDEFGILVGEISDYREALRVAHRIQEAVKRSAVPEGIPVPITVSIGIVLSHPRYTRPEELLRDAQAALQRAKTDGQGRADIFDAALRERVLSALQLEADLRQALDRNELSLEYQPILSMGTGEVLSCEALLRWTHPVRGRISPVDFIPVAEETGLIVPIGEWTLNEACRQLRAWREAGFGSVATAVNLSPRQFRHQELSQAVRRAVEKAGISPRMLKLELTESAVMEDPDGAAAILKSLREFGVDFSIDDFGTGYSSLAHLRRFPFSTVKIDRSFVRDVPREPDAVAIATAIVTMSHSLKLKVVAEGVETEEQRYFLKSVGCDEAQGFLFSPAVSPIRFAEILKGGLP